MAASGIRINWNGFLDTLNRASSGLTDTQGLMAEIGKAMKGQTIRRFQAGVDPEGNAWTPVKNPRRDSRGRRRSGRASPLVDTGRLRNSISFSATPFEVYVGSNLVYARIHQLGGQAGRGRQVTIPARPYLGLSEEDIEEIKSIVQDFYEGNFE